MLRPPVRGALRAVPGATPRGDWDRSVCAPGGIGGEVGEEYRSVVLRGVHMLALDMSLGWGQPAASKIKTANGATRPCSQRRCDVARAAAALSVRGRRASETHFGLRFASSVERRRHNQKGTKFLGGDLWEHTITNLVLQKGSTRALLYSTTNNHLKALFQL